MIEVETVVDSLQMSELNIFKLEVTKSLDLYKQIKGHDGGKEKGVH